MALRAGTRLGPYEIVAPLGAGGMGEVYRARDPRLDRSVAIKILPPHLRASANLQARFEREARTISQLTHPHICTLHDIGRDGDTDFLVMEYLDGETLAARLARGPLPLDQALPVGIEIASALQHAHRHGIVHRDLKPGNIMLTRTGVKLLDFGLAKLGAPLGAAATSAPTVAWGDTAEGTVLGTIPYMAPEQLEGKEADARSDIWALGCVLYEAVTGLRAFTGQSQASLIAAILEHEPAAIATVQPLAPPLLDHIVRTSLAKDPEERWQSAADVERVLRGIAPGTHVTGSGGHVRVTSRERSRRRLVAAVGLLLVVAAALAIVMIRRQSDRPVRHQVTVLPPPDVELTGSIALSSDGQSLAMTGQRRDGTTGLWVRRLEALEPRLLPQTDGAQHPFWSPDSRSVGFFAGSRLKRIEVAGGPPVELASTGPTARGGTWNSDGVIVYSPSGGQEGLYRISAAGGTPQRLTTLNAARLETAHRWPAFMPDGRHILFMARSNRSDARFTVAVTGLDDPKQVKELAQAESSGMYANGRLLFVRGTTLFEQPMDEKRLEVTGGPIPLLDDVWRDWGFEGLVGCTSSAAGTVACRRGGANLRLARVDRTGRELGFVGPPRAAMPTFRFDEQRLIVTAYDTERLRDHLWVLDKDRDAAWQLTRAELNVTGPVWSPDGRQVVFASEELGRYDLYVQPVERGSSERPLLRNAAWYKIPTDWSSDGRWVFYDEDGDLWKIPAAGGTPLPMTRTPVIESAARLSPDMRWLAYQSNESRRNEVYVRAYPGPAEPILVSTSGGTQPQWRRDGRELFYIAADRSLMAVDVDTRQPSPVKGAPKVVLPKRVHYAGYEREYCASSTGFLVTTVVSSAGAGTVTLLDR